MQHMPAVFQLQWLLCQSCPMTGVSNNDELAEFFSMEVTLSQWIPYMYHISTSGWS